MMLSAIPLPGAPAGSFQEGFKNANEISRQLLENRMRQLQNQYYGPNIQSEINQRNALTEGQNIHNKYLPEEYRLANALNQQKLEWNPRNWQSEIGLRGAQAGKINYLLNHPGLMGGEQARNIQSLMDMGYISRNSMQGANSYQQSAGNNQNYPSISQQSAGNYSPAIQQPGNQVNQNSGFNQSAPFQTGNQVVDAILNRPFAETAYRNQMTKGFNWVHLPVETKNQLIAQGYGMGVEPLKMMEYINNGMSLQQMAEAEGLDPQNLPPPIYPPTATTRTRIQQVEQVEHELDYLNSAVTPVIKRYADTFAGYSPARISDMLSDDEAAQKRFGEYIGALSLQTGISNGRVLQEGGRPGLEVMRMVKDSSLKGIDTHSPLKMTGIAYQAAQDLINSTLSRGARIRTTTGMNPMSEIGKSEYRNESSEKSSGEKIIKIVRNANGKLIRSS